MGILTWVQWKKGILHLHGKKGSLKWLSLGQKGSYLAVNRPITFYGPKSLLT